MATKSSSSPTDPLAAAGSPQNSATEAVQPANEVKQDTRPDTAPQNPKSVFVSSEPIREDQVENAVKFLSHPKVRDSPVIHRRNFLEKKGLTKEEIDEAFRRVPDPSPSAQATGTNQANGISTSTIQPAAIVQTPQTVTTVPAGGSSSIVTVARSRISWYHIVSAVGLLAISGAGTAIWVKSMIPRLKSWIRKVVLEEKDADENKTSGQPTWAEEAAAAAKSAAAAASDVANASKEMIILRNEEKVNMEKFMSLLQTQVKEMSSMSNSIQRLEAKSDNIGRTHLVEHGDYGVSTTNFKQTYANGAVIDSRSARSSSPPAYAQPPVAPYPKSFMEDLDDQSPYPNQQFSNSRSVPRSKPWEGSEAKTTARGYVPSVNGEGSGFGAPNNGVSYQQENETPVPWWQKKNARIPELDYVEAKQRPSVAQTSEQPIQRTWVPPQPPPIAMAEAAEAIRRPKAKKEAVVEDDSVSQSQPAEVTDELQRITKISESGGELEMHSKGPGINEGSSGLNSSEIEEVPTQSY
ncbi:Peroxisomal membrane protein PEX14 [Linum grandiflorum]